MTAMQILEMQLERKERRLQSAIIDRTEATNDLQQAEQEITELTAAIDDIRLAFEKLK